jgi:acetyl esterase/lipase
MISPSARIIAVTGSHDDNTAPAWGIAYVNAAKSAGANAEFIKVDGARHGFDGLANTVAELIAAEVAR